LVVQAVYSPVLFTIWRTHTQPAHKTQQFNTMYVHRRNAGGARTHPPTHTPTDHNVRLLSVIIRLVRISCGPDHGDAHRPRGVYHGDEVPEVPGCPTAQELKVALRERFVRHFKVISSRRR
jgi:hypothetical protein